MIRSRIHAGLVLWALAAPVFAQGFGGLPGSPITDPGSVNAPGAARKSGDDLLRPPSEPGIAPPLDIRIQGEGLALPPGVGGDEPVRKPDADRAPQSGKPETPPRPDGKRP